MRKQGGTGWVGLVWLKSVLGQVAQDTGLMGGEVNMSGSLKLGKLVA